MTITIDAEASAGIQHQPFAQGVVNKQQAKYQGSELVIRHFALALRGSATAIVVDAIRLLTSVIVKASSGSHETNVL